MNKLIILFSLLLFSCGESQEDKLTREANEQIEANNTQFKIDSIKTVRINKAMSTGLDYEQAEKQVNRVYKY